MSDSKEDTYVPVKHTGGRAKGTKNTELGMAKEMEQRIEVEKIWRLNI